MEISVDVIQLKRQIYFILKLLGNECLYFYEVLDWAKLAMIVLINPVSSVPAERGSFLQNSVKITPS